MGKTVFFLGAGFSADAGGPIQNDIIKWILDEKFLEQFKYEQTVVSARENFIRFIEKDLEINEKLWNNIALEDIFTPIDRAVVNNRSFKNFDIKKLVNLREEFHFLMGVAIHYGVDYNRKDDQYIDDFAKKLNEVAKKRLKNIANDNVSIISSNWDLLLDNSLNKILQQYCAEEKV